MTWPDFDTAARMGQLFDRHSPLQLTITGADEPWAEGWHEPKIGCYLHRVHHPRLGIIEVYHGALGMERKVATIRKKTR